MMFVGRQLLRQPEKPPKSHERKWTRRGSRSQCAAMERCWKAWITSVGKYTHIPCSCRKSCVKGRMQRSSAWTSRAGSHNRWLIITLVWPLLLGSYCMGYQSSVTLVRPHSFCGGEKKSSDVWTHRLKLKTLPIPTFSLQVLLCVLIIMNLKCCGVFSVTDIGHTLKRWQRNCQSSSLLWTWSHFFQ